ncbi:sugar phosphate isomerase/epimerase family protein [Catenulispora pinisilvae]|uniref:sugar phosphate isomerase/epimerase family protein n=1 Tax=Catenulispora pinisilvae TaxID=2705253 RepID=UPI001891BF3E|nr:sugar phosphate isomerase/epimerase [Catenulispora pinisilvae]
MTFRTDSTGTTEQVTTPKVGLSTSSVYPEPTRYAFDVAARLGYDGVELMVSIDPASQHPDKVLEYIDRYQVPVLSIHAPTLFWLNLKRVWGSDPWEKLRKSREAAERVGANVVVVHPPFRWQQPYAEEFAEGIKRLNQESEIRFAVENMYPWRASTPDIFGRLPRIRMPRMEREGEAYFPGWDPTETGYEHYVLDLSHTATARNDALAMYERMGEKLVHLHLADGTGQNKDEHLVPGRGSQPCQEVLERIARRGLAGAVILEVSTRRAESELQREEDLRESLVYARRALASVREEAEPRALPVSQVNEH